MRAKWKEECRKPCLQEFPRSSFLFYRDANDSEMQRSEIELCLHARIACTKGCGFLLFPTSFYLQNEGAMIVF